MEQTLHRLRRAESQESGTKKYQCLTLQSELPRLAGALRFKGSGLRGQGLGFSGLGLTEP